MKTSKLITVALAAMAATAAFILACGKGPSPASAQSCTAWEVSVLNLGDNCTDAMYPAGCRLPAGWEPVGNMPVINSYDILVRRCAP